MASGMVCKPVPAPACGLALILAFAMQSQRRNTSHTAYVEKHDVEHQVPPAGNPPTV